MSKLLESIYSAECALSEALRDGSAEDRAAAQAVYEAVASYRSEHYPLPAHRPAPSEHEELVERLRSQDTNVALLACDEAADAIETLSASTTVEQAVAGDKYLIWSNEHRAWWAPDRCGYTRHHERAGRYDREEALNIAGIRGGGWPTDGNPHEIAIPERDAVAQATIRQRGGR